MYFVLALIDRENKANLRGKSKAKTNKKGTGH